MIFAPRPQRTGCSPRSPEARVVPGLPKRRMRHWRPKCRALSAHLYQQSPSARNHSRNGSVNNYASDSVHDHQAEICSPTVRCVKTSSDLVPALKGLTTASQRLCTLQHLDVPNLSDRGTWVDGSLRRPPKERSGGHGVGSPDARRAGAPARHPRRDVEKARSEATK